MQWIKYITCIPLVIKLKKNVKNFDTNFEATYVSNNTFCFFYWACAKSAFMMCHSATYFINNITMHIWI